MDTFTEANKKVHLVETQWHYNTMVDGGFTPLDNQGIGFVRSYRYQKGDRIIRVTTGANADYWKDETTGDQGYWADLKPYINNLHL